MPRANASALAADSPTRSAPIRPGPAVAATSVTSSSVRPDARSASSSAAGRFSRGARGELRHDASVGSVRGQLRGNDVGEHAAVAVEQGHGGLVAGGLDAENEHVQLTAHSSQLSARPYRADLWLKAESCELKAPPLTCPPRPDAATVHKEAGRCPCPSRSP